MELLQQRMAKRDDSSYSVIFLEGEHQCFVIEDEHRDVKVKGETRIPARRYEIKFRKESTPLTKKYREKFDWFTHHLELQDVLNFTSIYIHIGNYESNTDGCLLVNKGVSEVDGEFKGANSTGAFIEFYKLISDTLNKGEQVFITIRDEQQISVPF